MNKLVLLAAVIPIFAGAQQTVPLRLGYQGRLISSGGTPLSGTKSVTFNLYKGSIGATTTTANWSETQALALTNGFYATFLGVNTPLSPSFFDGSDVYLGVTVDGEELKPRQQIGSVAYAYHTAYALDATNLIGGGTIAANSASVSGNVTTGGAVTASGTISGAAVRAGNATCGSNNVCAASNVNAGGDVNAAGAVRATGALSGASLAVSSASLGSASAGSLSASGDVTAGNVTASNNLSAMNLSVTGGPIQVSPTRVTTSVPTFYMAVGSCLPGDSAVSYRTAPTTCHECTSCTTGSHGWSSTSSQETCSYYPNSASACSGTALTCYATRYVLCNPGVP